VLRPLSLSAQPNSSRRLLSQCNYVHQSGLIHRDLKPANVLLTAAGEPKITDFGLAKNLDVTQGQTQSGEILGTPAYMAPEQAAGRIKEIGPATDIYALGAILYEMLTGKQPFTAATGLEMILKVIREEPASPSSMHIKLPRDLETICLKCLEKTAEQALCQRIGTG